MAVPLYSCWMSRNAERGTERNSISEFSAFVHNQELFQDEELGVDGVECSSGPSTVRRTDGAAAEEVDLFGCLLLII